MENASKALLIAGAVLLVIAIIAVAMGMFGTARQVVDQSEGQIDNMSIQMHNKQFEEYEGAGVNYDKVKELVSLIVSNNEAVGNKAFRVNFSYGYYINSSANSTFNESLVKLVENRTYNYTDDNMKDDIENYQQWILNKKYIYNQYKCLPVYDVKFIYSRIENGSDISNGMIKEIRIYAWHE